MAITADQIRAARALKNWSQADLAERVDMATPSIGNIESGKHNPTPQTQAAIIEAFEDAGIEFIDGGVRVKKHTVEILIGQEGFLEFYDDVYAEIKKSKEKTVCVSNVDERKFVEWQGDQLNEHSERMLKLGVRYQILIEHGDTFFPASHYADYRWMPENTFYTVPFYIYGDKLGMMVFGDEPRIYVLNEPEIAASYRKQFEEIWKKSEVPQK
ncbi:helix-turn-helix transcriptional regulator [Micavibrio aeruginosavorus]|uniref:helix-turn-helix transcriptional regulator n=1 Tax=Micavibrio aeruginosavorus TaxID=349221 RepID=UPI003F4A87A3